MNIDLLKIYLNDHLAGATAGVELARRTLRENKGNAVGQYFQALMHCKVAPLIEGEVVDGAAPVMRANQLPRTPVDYDLTL